MATRKKAKAKAKRARKPAKRPLARKKIQAIRSSREEKARIGEEKPAPAKKRAKKPASDDQ